MRIGFDAKRAFNNLSGLGNYSRYVISNICRFYPENDCLLYTPHIAHRKLFKAPEGSVLKQPDKGLWKAKGSLWRSFRLSGIMEKDGVDLYHGLSNELPYGIHSSKVKSLISIHDLIFLEHPELYKSIDRKVYHNKVRYGTRAASRIIAVSEQTKQDIIRHLEVDESRISVVYQGCHQQFYQSASEEELGNSRRKFSLPSDYLLYVGTIEERKNLLRVVMALKHGKFDIPLVVVGKKTSYYKRIKEYIRKHQLRHIHFLDHVQTAELPAIYQGSRGFIYPSAYEGFGIPVLEALNSGIPVITTRGGCLEETAGKGGILVDPFDLDEMTEAIRLMLEDSDLKDRLIREGGAHAMKFREEQTIPALYNVYLQTLNDGS